MDEARLVAVTGRRFPRRPAALEGFARVTAAHGYPTIVARPGAQIEGMLIEELDAAALAALDAYEDVGRLYARRAAEVVAGGRRVACEVYVSLTR
jgi:hypothetical protein